MWSAARHLARAPVARALVAAGGLSFLASSEPQERRVGPQVARCDGMLRARTRGVWDDLSELARDHETHDTWPWMWLSRNPAHKCVAFVGNSPELLKKMEEVAAQDRSATLVLVGKREEMLRFATQEELDRVKCVFLEGSVEKVDAQGCMLVTRDERMLEFDELTVMWASPRSRTGSKPLTAVEPAKREAAAVAAEEEEGDMALVKKLDVVEIYPSRGRRVQEVHVTGACRGIVKRKSLHMAGESLHHIVEAWKLSGIDTWPWVWLWRNPSGPLHVLVGSSIEVLQAARRRAAENPSNNIVIIGRRAELLQHAREEEYDQLRCAIVESDLEELDAAHGIAMLTDERVIEFDSLSIYHAHSSAHV